MNTRRMWVAASLAVAAVVGIIVSAAAPAVASPSAAAAPAEGQILGAGRSNAIPGSYIVVFKDSAVASSSVDATARDLAGQHDGKLGHLFQHALRGMEVELTGTQAKRLATNPKVKYVEQNATVSFTGTQTPTGYAWGLDRIDQHNWAAKSHSYTYTTTASNVRIYIIDSGIRRTHTDFGGRAVWGTNTTGDGIDTDCAGHGTHVAGIAAGATYGVAKGAQLTAVKVLGCNGQASDISQVVAGVDWVTGDHDPGELAVANMSVASINSSTMNDAVTASIADGITYAVSAGNRNTSACTQSPASTPNAITVGNTTIDDARYTETADNGSNYGTCVDLFAPGAWIASAYNTSDTATATLNGTSQASPHVAGAAALVLSMNPSFTPQQVRDTLVNEATNGVVTDAGYQSPNKLLFVAAQVPDVRDRSTAAASSALTAAGLTVALRQQVDKYCNYLGLVMSQSLAAGARVDPGTTVTITIGKKPSTPCP